MAVEQGYSSTREFVAGVGNIRERTIRLGNIILPVAAIDSISLTVKPRDITLIITCFIGIGAIVAVLVHGVNLDFLVSGTVFMVIVGVGVAVALRWPSQSVLAIGCGGRTYYLSGNKEFLIRLGELIRRKIDSSDESLTAEFDVGENLLAVAGIGAASERVAHN